MYLVKLNLSEVLIQLVTYNESSCWEMSVASIANSQV